MIRMAQVDDLHCPAVFCDACWEQISDPKAGNAVWLWLKGDELGGDVWHTHKKCHRVFELVMLNRPVDSLVCTSDLDKWLGHLNYNAAHEIA